MSGHLIREARLEQGLTQAQLARRMGITQPSVAQLEKAGDNITLATLKRALTAMGRGVVVQAVEQKSSVDETLLYSSLRQTPAERLTYMTDGYANVREFSLAAARSRAAT